MATRPIVETRRDRKALVADAGFSQLSLMSVFAGVLAAYGAFAVLAGIAVGVIKAANVDVDLASQWRDLGMTGGFVVAGLLLLAYLFGGYVAGRMARRSGVLHGVFVFVLGVAFAVGAAALARWLGGSDVAASNLRDLGVPTTAAEWRDVATVAGLASLAAMLVGAVAGSALGERWHSKLLARALDPQVGAEAEARRDAERRAAEAEELRVSAFRRARTTTPTRTRRVDDDDTVPVRRADPVRWSPNGDGNGNGDTRDAKVKRANAEVDRAADETRPLATGRRTGR